MKEIGIIAFVKKYYKKEIDKEVSILIKRGVAKDFARHQGLIFTATRRRKEYADKSWG